MNNLLINLFNLSLKIHQLDCTHEIFTYRLEALYHHLSISLPHHRHRHRNHPPPSPPPPSPPPPPHHHHHHHHRRINKNLTDVKFGVAEYLKKEEDSLRSVQSDKNQSEKEQSVKGQSERGQSDRVRLERQRSKEFTSASTSVEASVAAFPVADSVFMFNLVKDKMFSWASWSDLMNENIEYPKDLPYNEIIVPTVDTFR